MCMFLSVHLGSKSDTSQPSQQVQLECSPIKLHCVPHLPSAERLPSSELRLPTQDRACRS